MTHPFGYIGKITLIFSNGIKTINFSFGIKIIFQIIFNHFKITNIYMISENTKFILQETSELKKRLQNSDKFNSQITNEL